MEEGEEMKTNESTKFNFLVGSSTRSRGIGVSKFANSHLVEWVRFVLFLEYAHRP
jgi:hypothetical protein